MDHMIAALSKTFKSPVVDTIQSLPQHQQVSSILTHRLIDIWYFSFLVLLDYANF